MTENITNEHIKGQKFMGENVKGLLKKCGKDVTIHPLAKIVHPGKIEIGDYCIIDDFTFINGGDGVKLGKFVHIATFSSIIGGGTLEMEDFSGLSASCRIITGSDDFSGQSLTNPTVPMEFKPELYKGHIKIGKHAVLGTNTIVHPNVTIGEGAATGSNTVVLKDLEPWTIYVGNPARKIKDRKKDLLKLKSKLIAKFYDNKNE